MTIQAVLGAVAGRPDLFIWRPSGKVGYVTNRFAIQGLWKDKPRILIFTYSDIVTDDWRFGDRKALRAAFPEEDEAQAS